MLPSVHTKKIGKQLWEFTASYGPIPVGFQTDGASVPRLFWWFLDPATELFEAAAIHDYWLSKGRINKAHREFRDTALLYGVPGYKVAVAYFVVKQYFNIKQFLHKV